MVDFKLSLGRNVRSKTVYNFDLEKNTSSSKNQNFLFDCTQGTGKTNLLQLFMWSLYKNYLNSESKYGALPIIFSPLFEFANIGLESSDDNLPPNTSPLSMDSLQFCFEMSNPPPDNKDIRIVYIPFSELTVEDLASFAGYSEDNKILGKLQKMIEDLVKRNENYTIDDFIEELNEDRGLYNALYYVFTKLKRQGFFNEKYERFDWLTYLKMKKPIIFNFGDINIRDIYNTVTGYFLRKLFELSNVYYNAYTKLDRINKATNLGTVSTESLDDTENFLVKNFYLALFFEESHQIFFQTNSLKLVSFPAHYTYKQISDLLGRKKGFKYNFLVTQRIMELYKYFRMQQKYLVIGSEVYEDDREFMRTEMKFDKKIIPEICMLPKFGFSLINVNDMRTKKAGSVVKFKAFRSPCGQLRRD